MTDPREVVRASTRLLARVTSVYDRRLRKYGAEARGVFWKDAEWQRRRYEILYCIFDEVDEAGGLTLQDFGCGYGAFFDYLKDTPVMHRSRYIGTDMSQKMIDVARTRIRDPRATFVRHVWPQEAADYTFASGTYNMNLDTPADDWTPFIKASLEQLWRTSRKGLAFNMLRQDAETRYDGLYYADPEEFRDFCAATMSPYVTLTNDDPLPDFTIFVKRT